MAEKLLRITLKAARVNAGLTQTQAGEKMGVKKDKVLAWEKHPEKVTAAEMYLITKTYGIPADNLIFLSSD